MTFRGKVRVSEAQRLTIGLELGGGGGGATLELELELAARGKVGAGIDWGLSET